MMNPHAELNYSRRLGVEHEMTIPIIGSGGGQEVQETLAAVLTANGIEARARRYTHAAVPSGYDVSVETDTSVSGERRFEGISWHSVEMKSRILNGVNDWERVIPKALDIARYLGARVNRSTGYHVHVDFPEARSTPNVIRSLFNVIHRYEPLIYSIVAPSRKDNGYARPIPDGTSRMLHGCRTLSGYQRQLADWDRHTGLNLTHLFEDSPRIEFRWHQGTLDPVKARHWLRFLNRLVEHAVTRNCQAARTQASVSMSAFDNFLMTIGLRSNTGIYRKVSPELRETAKYLRKRFKQFHATGNSSDSGELSGNEDRW